MDKKQVIVMSQAQAENSLWEFGPIISITQPHTVADLNGNDWCDVLRLKFDDVTRDDEGYVMFDLDMADQVRRFAQRWEHQSRIFVHCAAGISRSVAIGMWIAEKQDRLLVLCAANSTSGYNVHVYNCLNHFDANLRIQEAFKGL